jgi:exonuclease SbcD
MRFIHTADWHIGQNFFNYDRKKEHLQFLRWLKSQVQEKEVDALLVAGDVFDSPNPTAESQRMLYRFLREVTAAQPGLQVVIIAGNHDSGTRLEAPDPLLEEMKVYVRGTVERKPDGEMIYERLIIPLMKGDSVAAWCLAVPYLRQGDYPKAENYAQGVAAMYQLLYDKIEDKTKPIVAIGHLQASGSDISENDRSERTLTGGLESVSPDAFDPGIAYTALGHLHRAQRVSGRENVRYAGAPLPMSFAEKNNKQGVTLVEITEGHAITIERIGFDPLATLLSIPVEAKPPAEVFEEIDRLPDGEITPASPYLEVKVLVTEPEPALRYRLEEALKNKSVRLARIASVTPKSERELHSINSSDELQSIHPMEVAADIFRKRFGGEEMPDTMRNLLNNVIREAER